MKITAHNISCMDHWIMIMMWTKEPKTNGEKEGKKRKKEQKVKWFFYKNTTLKMKTRKMDYNVILT